MKYEIAITVDTNDGDYKTAINEITQKQLDFFKPLIKAIKNFKPYRSKDYLHEHNYPQGECCREDLGEKTPQELYNFKEKIFEDFEELCPYNDYGFHTVESIEIYPIPKKERLL